MDLDLALRAATGVGNAGSVAYQPTPVAPLTVVAAGGATRWYDLSTLCYSAENGGGATLYDVRTGQARVVDSGSVNALVAGGGAWAVSSNLGYRDSYGTHQPDWVPIDADDTTGDLAVILQGSTGYGIGVTHGTAFIPIIPVSAHLNQIGGCFRNGVLWFRQANTFYRWTRAGGLQTIGTLPIQTAQGGWADGGWLQGYRSDVGYVAFPIWPVWTPTRALQISQGYNYNPVIRFDATTGQIVMVSSSGAGEAPNELQRYVIDPVAGTVNGHPARWVDLTQPPTPEPEPEPPQPEPEPLPEPEPPMPQPDVTCISAFPTSDPRFDGCTMQSCEVTPHQDAGFVGIRRTDLGKFRNVSDDGTVEDNRDSAGAGERFTRGVGSTVIARRGNANYVFLVA